MTLSNNGWSDYWIKSLTEYHIKCQIEANPHLAQTTIISCNQKKFIKFRDEMSFFSSLLDIVRCEWFN